MSKFMKFWLLIICFLFIFLIIFTDRVKAEVLTCNAGDFSKFGQTGNNIIHSWSNNCFKNKGEGNVIVNFTIFGKALYKGTYLYVNNNVYMCEDTNFTAYVDNSAQTQHVSAVCHLPNISSTGVQQITIYTVATGQYDIYATPYLSYTNVGTAQNYTSSISNINTTLSNIDSKLLNNNTWNQYIFDKLGDIETLISQFNGNQTTINNSIQAQTQQQHQDALQHYNYISDTNISSENYTNTQSISDNNTNSETKSVVMNFWLIPLNFFNSIIASFENSCSQVCIGECSNGSGGAHDNALRFVFPCLDIKSLVGNSIYNTVDAFFAIGMIFAFIRRAKNFFMNALMLTTDAASEVSVF